jgi:TPR repeat protein
MGAPNVSAETLIFATQLGSADGDWAAYLTGAIMDSPAITSEILEQIQVWNFDQAWELFLHPLASTELAQKLKDEYVFADLISGNSREEISAIIEAKLEQGSNKTAEEQFQLGETFYDDKSFSHALPILKSAADQGHDLAAEKTANCYSKLGYPELAVPYWEFCRTEGNHSANTNYANYLTSINRNLEFALRLWKEAAEAGIPQAAFNLGVWLKNSGDVEKGKLYLKKAGELGYLDGYFVLAGVFYKEEDWDSMNEFLAPLLEIGDKRAVTMQKAVQEKLKESEFIDAEDEEDDEYVFHSFGERTIKLDDA